MASAGDSTRVDLDTPFVAGEGGELSYTAVSCDRLIADATIGAAQVFKGSLDHPRGASSAPHRHQASMSS